MRLLPLGATHHRGEVRHPAATRLLAAFVTLLMASAAAASPRTINVGYQKYGTLVFEKTRGTLERALSPLGVTVTWTEFLGGPALLEAMGAAHLRPGRRR